MLLGASAPVGTPLIWKVLSTKQVLPSRVVAPPTPTETSLNTVGETLTRSASPGSVLKNPVFCVSVTRYVPGVRLARLCPAAHSRSPLVLVVPLHLSVSDGRGPVTVNAHPATGFPVSMSPAVSEPLRST